MFTNTRKGSVWEYSLAMRCLNNDSKHEKNTHTEDKKPQITQITNKNMSVTHNTKSKGENLLKGPGGRPGMATPGNQLLGLSGPKCLIFRLAEECTARKVLTSAPLLTPPTHTHLVKCCLTVESWVISSWPCFPDIFFLQTWIDPEMPIISRGGTRPCPLSRLP